MRRLLALLSLSLLLCSCEKKNPNYEPPPPYDGKVVDYHHFDGGATDPYQHKSDDAGGDASAPEKSE